TESSGSSRVALVLDQCTGSGVDHAALTNGGTAPSLANNCLAEATPAGLGLDTGDWPVQIGGRYQADSSSQYPTGLPRQGVVAQLAQLRVGNQLIDLVADNRSALWRCLALGSGRSIMLRFPLRSERILLGRHRGFGAPPMRLQVWLGSQQHQRRLRCAGANLAAGRQQLRLVEAAEFFCIERPKAVHLSVGAVPQPAAQWGAAQSSGRRPLQTCRADAPPADSRLVAQLNTGDYVLREAVLPNSNVSDGGLHTVRVCRSLQLMMEVMLDSGEGINYATLWGSFVYNYNYIQLGQGVIGGASVTVDTTGSVTVQPPQDDLQSSCLAGPLVNSALLPADSAVSSPAAELFRRSALSLVSRCSDPSVGACPAGATCPQNQVCLGTLQPSGSTVCGCLPDWTMRGDRCYASPCFPLNPCQNGGYCIPGGGLALTCRCLTGFSAPAARSAMSRCSPSPEPASSSPWCWASWCWSSCWPCWSGGAAGAIWASRCWSRTRTPGRTSSPTTRTAPARRTRGTSICSCCACRTASRLSNGRRSRRRRRLFSLSSRCRGLRRLVTMRPTVRQMRWSTPWTTATKARAARPATSAQCAAATATAARTTASCTAGGRTSGLWPTCTLSRTRSDPACDPRVTPV
ncbi:hypothetical protein BOX15_Mlig029337g1, partial [Macrostomum lignano]